MHNHSHAHPHAHGKATELSASEQELLDKFLSDNRLYLGPDPEIMRSHAFAPRTADEERVLSAGIDPHQLNLVRGRLTAALAESFTMVEQMGTAPGAKWGDLVTAVYTISGDLSAIGPQGIVVFSGVCHYPLKYIIKYWMNEPTVGVHDGDGFIHNDSRYGNIHNTDQSMILPVFYKGEIVCWVSSTIHEGENGACEPGGMPAAAESKFDEGLKMSPFKVVENFKIKRDLLTFLQNSVRDPKLQLEDMKVKLHACLRLRQRILALLDEYGKDALTATLRMTIEDADAEVRRRIAELPQGTVRSMCYIDSTLRENILIKFNIAITIKDGEMIIDMSGTSPEFINRSINTSLGSFKTCLASHFLTFVWPDLPHNMASFAPIKVITQRNSVVDCSDVSPNAMSLIPLFRAFILPATIMAKLLYALPNRTTAISASHYSQPATLIYGGITQHGEVTGNFCADINGNGQGARHDRDGEHALSPVFGFMCDTGEHELIEETLPIVRLVAQHLSKDRCSFGKYRGGMGYDQMATSRESNMWGFMTGCTGSLHSSTTGIFGGYGCPAYPLVKIKDINIFDTLRDNPETFNFDIVKLMNERPFPGASYTTHDMGMTFELAKEGEIYAISQGSGGGYGDVLERDPELVMKDIEEDLISHETAWDMYRVVYDRNSLVVDLEATAKARQEEREARKRRGVPFKEFIKTWTTAEPPKDIPYYGSWSNDKEIFAGIGETRIIMDGDNIQGAFMENPKDKRIAQLEAEVATLKRRCGEAAE